MAQTFDYRIRKADHSISLSTASSGGDLPAETDAYFWVRLEREITSIRDWKWDATSQSLVEMTADEKRAVRAATSLARSDAAQETDVRRDRLKVALQALPESQRAVFDALFAYLGVEKP